MNIIAVKQPSAVIPIVMSVAALATVLAVQIGAALAAAGPVYWLGW